MLDPLHTNQLPAKVKSNKLMNDADLARLKARVVGRVRKLDSRLSHHLSATITEKAFYAFALYSIFACGIILTKYPEWFHVFYTAMFVLLMPVRFYTYFKMSFQYFLADLCYFINMLLLLYIWVFPQSRHLYMTLFSFSFGTLSWAVITWRNSLVLHSIEKTTSSFIHIMPPVTLFAITHQISPEFKLDRFPGAAAVAGSHWHVTRSLFYTSLYYLVWQSFYHYFITVKKADKIKAGKRVTSFEWLRKKHAHSKLGMAINSLPEPLPVFAFMFIQYFYQISTMVFVPLWFRSDWLCAGFLTFIFIWASFNGATYYIDVFGNRLEKEVARLEKEIMELQEESTWKLETKSQNMKF
ncbi:hypothetical protein BABINDRAFT_172223 [Babjeviella inositovora NRRL Y-12698]|uniref:Glycerophosphocholine acyltransferase 1 n=1 Tax=Babjeviella inositovora NRRL Y-12698 TaxID=984486 RepID=A0A1E3QN65_9ASCO|nr:uncharacterized protein BABINDRAFT_172223 [Babjeviella inositovora NRRL Y-12698]ODQ78427.1 hypothetical protein BABINDRAFT_172223 [Babjeviella inositovora NRRL Y-12698]